MSFGSLQQLVFLISDTVNLGVVDRDTIRSKLNGRPRMEFSNCVQTMSDKTLYQQLRTVFPYRKEVPIPKSIWRSWKTKELDSDRVKITDTWKNIAPDWTMNLFDDKDMDDWVKKKYWKVPQVLAAWYLMPRVILRSDLFRYLVLLANGGIWSGTFFIFISQVLQSTDMDVTLNDDQPTGKYEAQRRFQIAQYCMMFKAGHPALINVIANVIIQTMNRAEAGLLKDTTQKDIEEWTGPGPYTDEIFWYWNRRGPGGAVVDDLDKEMQWNAGYGSFGGTNVTGFENSLRIGDLILLHKSLFNDRSNKDAYIVHHTSGTWRNDLKE
ncbi:hypothetical protein PROFUN_13329 [Planoprotostelium fungivorum]|uniref:Uncharacterized protein n=1 Tax=Planoprotostelium fungivorum TaxID=1890364 RepID=A0A2P6N4J8_9EUKA|nr:hypothetical protein PROFUN_13329 [Planoprotostelium fungivorum]